MQRDGGAELL